MTTSSRVVSARASSAVTRLLWSIILFLVLIGVAIVIRRATALVAPSPTPRFAAGAALDAGFAKHPVLTMVHIFPGLLFVLLGPLQFVRGLRSRRPALHRWTGRIVVASGLIIGSTALIMSPQVAIGGTSETAATMLFGTLFLFCLTKGFVSIRQRKIAVHREWMIRAFAIGLAVTTVRPIVGIFFATSPLTHLAPRDFFGAAFWLGFTISTIVAEVWINYTRSFVPQTEQNPRF